MTDLRERIETFVENHPTATLSAVVGKFQLDPDERHIAEEVLEEFAKADDASSTSEPQGQPRDVAIAEAVAGDEPQREERDTTALDNAIEAELARQEEDDDDEDDVDSFFAAAMGDPDAAEKHQQDDVDEQGWDPTSAVQEVTAPILTEPEICEPPLLDTEPFDAEERWAALQGERFDAVLEHDSIDMWGDEAGAGKTTNAGLAALERDLPHAIYFDKHEKAREFVQDDVFPDDVDYYHLKGGEQKRKGHCMDADHADRDCPEHGDSSMCPSMCPVYDLESDHDTRQAYEALLQEVGPNKAHQILELQDEAEHPWHGGECAWQHQYSEAENANYLVGVHPYVTQKSIRETGLNIIDETPDLHARERTFTPTALTRVANTLEHVADLKSRDDPVVYTLRELARFARDVVDVITDATTDDRLDDLEPPTVTWNAYESYDNAAGNYVERDEAEEDWHLAEGLAKAKLAHGETILTRMQNDQWEGTPIAIDPLLAAAVQAGLKREPVMQAVALPAVLDNCPWCGSELGFDNGARCCYADDCDWHEQHNSLVQQNAEAARGSAWLGANPAGADAALRYRELPLTSDLPRPSETLVLDATATPAKVAALFGVDREDVQVSGDDPVEIPNLNLTQVVDGQYHASTIKDSDSARERIQSTIDTAGDLYDQPLFILRQDLMRLFEFPEGAETLHYHATRGLNRAECDAVFCIGAPHPRMSDLERNAELLAQGRDDVRVGGQEHSTRPDAAEPVYRKLYYEDEAGQGRAMPTKHYTGLVGELFRETREKELVQAVHRIRPVLADDGNPKDAYLLTNVPTSLVVDDVVDFAELADPLSALLDVPDRAFDLLGHVRDVAAGEAPDGFRAEALVEERDDGTLANKVDGFHRLAQLHGMDVSERTVYDWVDALEDVGLLHPEEYEQHAGVSYTADFATLQSALQVITHNAGFEVAALRRLRGVIEDGADASAWLDLAKEVVELAGRGGGADPPPAAGG